MKRPLAYITAAWCGDPDTDMELAILAIMVAIQSERLSRLNWFSKAKIGTYMDSADCEMIFASLS